MQALKWTYTLGRFFGIRVQLHATFLLLLLWIAATTLLDTGSLPAVVGSVLFVAALFGLVVLHEYGHALTARAFGVSTRQITLYPIGGVAMLERMPDKPREQLLIALAGPAVNFLLAGLIAVLLSVSGNAALLAEPLTGALSLLALLFWANVIMGSFNLLPALPMDGGRVLRALLAMRMSPPRATRAAAKVAKFVALGMAVFAFAPVLSGGSAHLMLFAIAVMVWFMSGVERRAAERSADEKIRARAYSTDAFAGRYPAGAVDVGSSAGGASVGGGDFFVTFEDGPEGRRMRVFRVRR